MYDICTYMHATSVTYSTIVAPTGRKPVVSRQVETVCKERVYNLQIFAQYAYGIWIYGPCKAQQNARQPINIL